MPYKQLFNTKYFYHPTYIGHGITSFVYKGYFLDQNENKIFVAIKQIDMNKISLKVANYIQTEIYILQSLSHPNIVKMYDNFELIYNDIKYTFIVFEWLSKYELDILINNTYNKWSDDDILYLFTDIVNCVKYLHENNIIHRDIKPSNIVLVSNNKSKYKNIGLKLIDFGFSIKVIDNELHNTMCGSPIYMAPEIPLNKPYSKKVDIWALGVVLHQMKYGCVPFKGCKTLFDLISMWEKNNYKIGNNDIDNPINILINNLLDKNPDSRYSCDDIINYINLYFDKSIYQTASSINIKQSLPMPISNISVTQIFDNHNHSKFKFSLENKDFINKSLTLSTIPRVGSLDEYFLINYHNDIDESYVIIDNYSPINIIEDNNESIFSRILIIDDLSIDKCMNYINNIKNMIYKNMTKLIKD